MATNNDSEAATAFCEKYKPLTWTRDEFLAFIAGCEHERAEMQAGLRNWKDEYENVCKFANDYEEQRDKLRAELAREREKSKALAEALKFYSTGFAKKLTDSMMGVNTPALGDGGRIAREALAKYAEEEK